ncbi:MAG: ABC transporter substrate-binding protein [Deltaproteobacteria bacterium]|nr:ABC transporter substrate-binding protein [Deltaproteobacteria bacterium]
MTLTKLYPIVLLLSVFIAAEHTYADGPRDCSRIVSLAPSITETLYAVGLGHEVVGVTRYCLFPEEALRKEKVGGLLDPNTESIVRLKPTLAVLPKEQRTLAASLASLGIDVMTADHTGVAGILSSISEIGAACSRSGQAADLRSRLEHRLEQIRKRVDGLPRIRTMVVVGRGDPSTKGIYVSGRDGFYSDLVSIAGGDNVNTSATIAFPIMSAEGIISVNPQIVFEITFGTDVKLAESEVLKEWRYYSQVEAVKSNRIHVFAEHHMSIPGPRFIAVLERMAKLMHPEAEWKE